MKLVIWFGMGCVVVPAMAGGVIEVENNNTLVLANDVGLFDEPGGSAIITADLGVNDVDWFSFTLGNTATLSVFAAFSPDMGDGVLQIVSDGGDVIAFDDDSGIGFMPSLQLVDLEAGKYFVGFSGFGDADAGSIASDELLDGIGHDESFGYKLAIGFTVVPAPTSAAILGLGGLMLTRRRR
ncbi:MAG: PEP-CTERM sorting domain-containing protein [Planctomycetota bacterium]